MPRPRSLFAGDTDYTGVALADIIEHLTDWRDVLGTDAVAFKNIGSRIAALPPSALKTEAVAHAHYFADLCSRFAYDFSRLVREIPHGVDERHIETLQQLFVSSREAEERCIRFKQRNAKAEREAGLRKLEGSLVHAYRRKWRSERSHLPTKAVMTAEGWEDESTMLRCYDHPHDADVLLVTGESRKRREMATVDARLASA